MILNLDDEILLDVDKVSAVIPASKYIVVGGTKVTILKEKYLAAIVKAFKWQHQTHMYNKELKREGGK
jgi:hypothetical protein